MFRPIYLRDYRGFHRWLSCVIALSLLLSSGLMPGAAAPVHAMAATKGPTLAPEPAWRESALPPWFALPQPADTQGGEASLAPQPPHSRGHADYLTLYAPDRASSDHQPVSQRVTDGPSHLFVAPPLIPRVQGVTSTLLITKTDSPDPVPQGELITYIITVSNQGPTRTAGLLVNDAVPQNTTFDSAGVVNNGSNGGDDWVVSGPSVGGTGVVTWTARPIAPFFPGDSQLDNGEYAVLQLKVRVKSPIANGTTITNTATVSASNAVSTASYTQVTTVAAPQLTISKFASADVITSGLPLTYTIRVTNSGSYTLTGSYIITDMIPDYVTYNASSYTDPPATGYDSASRTLTWTLSTPIPPAGSGNNAITVTCVVTVNSPLTNNTQIVNSQYMFTSPQIPAPVTGSPVTTTVRSWAKLSLAKIDSPDPVQAGAYLTYTLLVTNEASATGYALTTTITDTVPQSTTLIGATGAATQASGTAPGGVVTWTLDSPLAPGASVWLTMTLQVTSPLVSGTILENGRYGVTATDALSPVAGALVTTTVNSAPVVTVTKSVTPAWVLGGGLVTYTIMITNSGNESALVAVTDSLPSGFSFNGMVTPPNPTDNTPPDIVWSSLSAVGRNLSGTPGVLTLTFTSTAPITKGVYYNLVTVTFGLSEVATGPTAPVLVGSPELRLIKDDSPDPVQAGDYLTYTLTYSNASAIGASGVVITDILPANTVFIATYGYSLSVSGPTGGVITWYLGSLNQADGNRTITLVLSVVKPLADGTILTNTAGIVEATGVATNAVQTTTVSSQPILHIVKGSEPPPGMVVQAGGLITYIMTVSNTGNATATNTIVTDVIPANTSYASGGTYVAASNWVSFTVDDLGLNAPQSYTFVVTVTSPLANGTIITDDLYAVTSEQTATVGTVPITHRVASSHTLHILKNDAPYDPVPSGSRLTYTIAYSVTGNEASSGATISDAIPANTAFADCDPTCVAMGSDVWQWWLPTPLNPGASGMVTMVVTVTTPLPDRTILTNTAHLYDSNDGVTAAGTETTTVVAADVAITKTVMPGVARPNWVVTYTITYQNRGSITATNVFITDTLPLSLVQVFSSSANASFVGGTMPTFTWQHNGDLGPNVSGTIIISGPLATTPWGPLTATLTNTAEITLSGLTADGGNPANPNQVAVAHTVRPDDPFTLTLEAVPLSTTVGSTVALTATVTDRWGNPVLNDTPVTFSSSLGAFVESELANYIVGTTDGRATATLTSTTSGTATVTAWSGSPVVSDTVVITFATDMLHHFAISYIPSPQSTCANFTIVISAQDRYNNTITSFTGTVSLTDTTNTLRPATSDAFVGGAWSGPVSVTNPLVSDLITATYGTTIGVSNPFTVTPGPLASLVVLVSSPAISACGATATITAVVRDQCGSLVWAGVPITFYNTTPSRGTLPSEPYYTATDNNGQATALFTSGTATGTATIWVRVTPSLLGYVEFEVTPGPATQVLVTAVPGTIPINTTTAVTATVRDCAGSPISGTLVNFTWSPLGSLAPPSGTSNATGAVTAVFTAGNSPGVAIITATASGLPPATTLVTITAGTPATVTVYAVPATLPANGVSTTTITATVVDTYGSPIPGAAVVLSVTPSFGGIFVTSASGNTDASGVFTAIWRSGTISGTATVTAEVGSRVATNTITLTSTLPVSGNVYLPIILKNFAGSYDLIVTGISWSPPNPKANVDNVTITVTVRNVGADTINSSFWVDLYITNTTFTTPTLNQRWDNMPGMLGVAWRVYGPILPGGTVVLSNLNPNDPGNPGVNYSRFTPPSAVCSICSNRFPSSGTWYMQALADSYGSLPFGAVVEINENNNASIQVTVNVTGLGFGATSEGAMPPPPSPPNPQGLGPRPPVPGSAPAP